jgi:sulfur carrier protein ThiS
MSDEPIQTEEAQTEETPTIQVKVSLSGSPAAYHTVAEGTTLATLLESLQLANENNVAINGALTQDNATVLNDLDTVQITNNYKAG